MHYLSRFKHLYSGTLLFLVLFGSLGLTKYIGAGSIVETAWAACSTAGTVEANDGNCYTDPVNKRGYYGPATTDTVTKEKAPACDKTKSDYLNCCAKSPSDSSCQKGAVLADVACSNTFVLDFITCTLGKIVGYFTSGLQSLIGGDDGIIAGILKAFTHVLGGQASSALPGTSPRSLTEVYDRYGALGALGLGVQQMYQSPPVTTADYLATIHPIAPAFAEVTGSQVLNNSGQSPTVRFWALSRNLAYTFFAVILVVIGLMVMFRSKIDPRTTVSVTAALPNLIVALVMITFSLAFAGFIIDIGRVLMDLFRQILLGTAFAGGAPVPDIGNGVGLSTADIWGSFVLNLNNGVSFGGIGGGIVGFFVTLIVMVFAFIVGIQVFVMLLFRYINLLLKPVFAPFVFLFGALPGHGGSMGNWFKSYLVDAITFPLVFIVLNIALAIKNSQTIASNDPFGFLTGGANLNSLLAIGVLFTATKIPAMLEEALDVKPASHVDRAGSQPSSMLKSVPIVKNFL